MYCMLSQKSSLVKRRKNGLFAGGGLDLHYILCCLHGGLDYYRGIGLQTWRGVIWATNESSKWSEFVAMET